MIINLNVIADDTERSIGWISFQPDGAISVGLTDRTFISPKFRARNFLWNYYNRITLEYLVADSPEALEPINNPHLTFHPPIYFHLRANGQEELFAGIAEPRLMLGQDERVPWIRFVSRPLREIGIAKQPRDTEKTFVEKFLASTLDCSIGLGVDFIRPTQTESSELLFSRCIDWKEHRVHVFCEILPAQISTLSWYHQS